MKKSLGARTLLYPTPVLVVGSYDKEGRANVMTASWGGICCSSPPCIAVSLRKVTFSYGNVMERQAFTINIPSEEYLRQADYFGTVSGKNEDKFAATGLTPVKGDFVDAPYVKEFPLVIECKVLKTVEIGIHTQFVGEIMDVKADEAVIDAAGMPDIEKLRPAIFTPESRSYYGVGKHLGKAFSIGKR
ncbi:MAG: flavin reductase family protein [Candidatus Sulfobium sp.]|jgi:flavin reductase (DIM6/NTAB) family NADH-FMN oxidoreductase RutF